MDARLAIYKGTKLDRAFPLGGRSTAIGRDADNPVQMIDPKVSKRHAVIRAKGEAWAIEDAGSTNGLTVNGARVKSAELKHGDKIRIGPFHLVFETDVDGEWVPTHVINMTSKAIGQTIPQEPTSQP
jgi:pSer/pThr/pTyr-binding forkhead associated (FHA) protein